MQVLRNYQRSSSQLSPSLSPVAIMGLALYSPADLDGSRNMRSRSCNISLRSRNIILRSRNIVHVLRVRRFLAVPLTINCC